ncbi:MAG TPA: radical SAM protein [Pseudomonadales bacterium]|nr:radical SAM protein [Pseudomonadales bacterium]
MKEKISLSRNRHDRDSAGLTYVYPVLSRRAKGVSIGINLNTNNACNWRCVYCQVPNLQRGAAPAIDLQLLEKELRDYLAYAEQNDFEFFDDDGLQWPVVDICFSGNGEPTASPQFSESVDLVISLLTHFKQNGKLKLVLISNGSEVYKPEVQSALKKMARNNGEIWFKLDAGAEADWKRINQTHLTSERVLNHLRNAANCIPVRIQTCVFGLSEDKVDQEWLANYLAFMQQIRDQNIAVLDVLLYSVARPPQLPEGALIERVSPGELHTVESGVRALGFSVQAFTG